jgi:hypothetical protein
LPPPQSNPDGPTVQTQVVPLQLPVVQSPAPAHGPPAVLCWQMPPLQLIVVQPNLSTQAPPAGTCPQQRPPAQTSGTQVPTAQSVSVAQNPPPTLGWQTFPLQSRVVQANLSTHGPPAGTCPQQRRVAQTSAMQLPAVQSASEPQGSPPMLGWQTPSLQWSVAQPNLPTQAPPAGTCPQQRLPGEPCVQASSRQVPTAQSASVAQNPLPTLGWQTLFVQSRVVQPNLSTQRPPAGLRHVPSSQVPDSQSLVEIQGSPPMARWQTPLPQLRVIQSNLSSQELPTGALHSLPLQTDPALGQHTPPQLTPLAQQRWSAVHVRSWQQSVAAAQAAPAPARGAVPQTPLVQIDFKQV